MKNLLFILALGAVAAGSYFAANRSCPLSGANANAAADSNSAATTISTEPQDNVPAGWITDYDAALKQAKEENKAVLIDFTGSDWCGWCKKLDKEVFSKPEFEQFAEKNLVRVYLDFPSGKAQSVELEKQNQELAKKFGVEGFPTILVLNHDGKPLAQIGYQPGGPVKYVETLEEIISPKEKS
ncbi:thioredoxin family protein [Cerasicoccus arenae]|uniref:Thioredoxin n=1 Tax=Cerasicoccus arenae TaxID=424488 RepID=A0A8J3D8A8_9BACT|nr:thioredoxin family protein [Cerasicoccus arenae]MBK1859018.1 thioredoxin family protein [Cerasicoccus arenae]GHB94744.1 thioredoxin [Cerasicoccus arenae]